MKNFAYASARHEAELLDLISPERGNTQVLAGGTDLVGLMKKMLVMPELVVNIMEVDSLRGIQSTSQGVILGAVTTLDELLESPDLDAYSSIKQAIAGIHRAPQLTAQGTLGGELCQWPRCWYFRGGHGLLADEGKRATQGDSRYHAILGNAGPAKFVSASRLAPALIALGAQLRIAGPGPEDESIVPVEFLFRTPKQEGQREITLLPGQVVTHIMLPPAERSNATYEVRHGAGPDDPLAAAAAALRFEGSVVSEATIVLGHVAPIPWIAHEAATALIGQPVNQDTARAAGEAAVRRATPLKDNEYKIQLARVAVQRAVLLAAGLSTGGF